ncbi:MAG: ClpXP protease specificity-enhancing factor [Rhodoferax sp.]|uniref:ClpXP protease specificity-enhancing factor n=1 Tax=Rhodoferax sp. TaxID=50421 RepID=UPI00261F3565|nr:ClpXP protease specificity-enhancing factor [Rhodoferax sp.]MDD2879553.1 ClpXP protease specificity-enhancing factor [Rhodoferax sp.]
MTQDMQTTSTRPYLIRALHEWCGDNGLTPYVTVLVDNTVQVPREFVKDGEIVLNIGFDATTGLQLGNEFMEFKARFGGVVRDIFVPIGQVVAIFAKENGQGMAFPRDDRSVAKTTQAADARPAKPSPARLAQVQSDVTSGASVVLPESVDVPKPGKRPSLTRIK